MSLCSQPTSASLVLTACTQKHMQSRDPVSPDTFFFFLYPFWSQYKDYEGGIPPRAGGGSGAEVCLLVEAWR